MLYLWFVASIELSSTAVVFHIQALATPYSATVVIVAYNELLAEDTCRMRMSYGKQIQVCHQDGQFMDIRVILRIA